MRKKNLKIYGTMVVVLVSFASFGLNTTTYATENVNQSNTEVAVTLTRKIIPSELPGNSGKPNNGTNTAPKIPNQAKSSTGSLPKTGTLQSYWGILGSLLIGMIVMMKSLERNARKLREE